jgi:methyltransferase (TIGR00027 family)
VDLPSIPDNTAVRTALWRALHLKADAPPHVLNDLVGMQLVAPAADWLQRPDMEPDFSKPFRAAIVARARYIEDLALSSQVGQYVILGAGLDSFAQRHPNIGARLKVFEIDRAGTQAWKQVRLAQVGHVIPDWLRFVPADFETTQGWWQSLLSAGFDAGQPALVVSTGVSMYLTREAIVATLRQVASLAAGSTFAMSFLRPFEMPDPGIQRASQGARASGNPFISFFQPDEIVALAREVGFESAQHVSADQLAERYFAGRTDGLRPPSGGEEILLATV